MRPELICEYYGGSHSYSLNTSDSDLDYRGVFITSDIKKIINPHEYTATNSSVYVTDPNSKEKLDQTYYEIRHFLHLLKKGNTTSVELIFNKKWNILTPLFKEVIKQRNNLIDPGNLYNAIRGYAFSEYKFAVGSNTGKLGSKRQIAVSTYGFSPKNWTNLLRIIYCGEIFFETGEYPVDLAGSYIHPQLMEIKTKPDRFAISRLEEMYTERQRLFEASWIKNKAKICHQFKYNDDVATDLMLRCYINKINNAAHRNLFNKILGYIRFIL